MSEQRNTCLEIIARIGQEVQITGWVQARRNMGKIVFLDVRDRTGFVQVVGVPAEVSPESLQALQEVRLEYLVEIRGVVQERGEKQKNPNLPTGSIELLAKEIKIISSTEALPFEVTGTTKETTEALRLKYRYLDLRSDRMRENLKKRHEMNHFLRNFFTNEGFWEVETPCLTKGTPEGSREYIVPSRLHAGSFYVLPQSPQQFKQLLMVAGVEKYFQIARCFRDEDQRGDRQPEFTQFDLEMSFVKQEDIMQLIERAMIELVEKLYPHLIIQQKPFPVLTYREAMDQYGVDKPGKMSIRASLGIHNIVFDVGENDEIGHAVERASTALMKYVSAQLIRNLFNKG
jgi:aspartyl-tRNA synthetase